MVGHVNNTAKALLLSAHTTIIISMTNVCFADLQNDSIIYFLQYYLTSHKQ